jgi:hypothetical protein
MVFTFGLRLVYVSFCVVLFAGALSSVSCAVQSGYFCSRPEEAYFGPQLSLQQLQ